MNETKLDATSLLFTLHEKILKLEEKYEGEILALKEEIHTLKEEIAVLKSTPQSNRKEGLERFYETFPDYATTRKTQKEYLVSLLNEKGIPASSGSQCIVLQKEPPELVKFYLSNNRWCSVQQKSLDDENITLFLFILMKESDFLPILIPREEMFSLISDKKRTKDGKYHFDFVESESHVLETRDHQVDVTKYVGAWHLCLSH
jgi:hypothetical protein